MFIEFAQLRNGLLNHALADTYAANQSPVAMNFAVLLAGRVAQVHAHYQNRQNAKRKHPRSALHAQIRATRHLSL